MNYLALIALSILAVEHLPVWVFGLAFCALAGCLALLCWWLFVPHAAQPKSRKVTYRRPVHFRACAVGCAA